MLSLRISGTDKQNKDIQDSHLVIPGTWKYVTLQGKGKFVNIVTNL
jgi:hypothetical protein